MNKTELIAQMELLKLKHKMAIEMACELVGHPDYTREQLVDEAFGVAQLITDRIKADTDIFALKASRQIDEAGTDFDPIQHFMNSLMSSIARSKGQVQ